jgi:Amt family ammonium transporter
MAGTLLTGVFAATAFGGQKDVEPLAQLWIQAKALGVAILWSAIGTLILAWIVDKVLGLRAPRADERDGLDLTHHGEVAYIIEERS